LSSHPFGFGRATPDRPVVVIGAGIAGLVAATRLKAAGVPVVVLERSDHRGGRMQTSRPEAGHRFETGQQFYYGAYRRTRALLKAHNLLGQLRPAPVRGLMTYGGDIAPFDKKRPWLGLLSTRENLRLWMALGRLSHRMLFTSPFGHKATDSLDSVSVDGHFLPRIGERAFELAIRPMVTSYSFAEPEGHSLSMLLKIARLGASSGTLALIPGNDSLPMALARGLDVRTLTATGIERGPDGWVVAVHATSPDGAAHSIETGHVVCAAPPPQAAPLFGAFPAVATALHAIPFTATIMVNFHLDRPLADKPWVYILSRRDGHRAAFAIDCARRCPEAFPLGDSVLQVSFVAPIARELLASDDSELAAIAAHDMRTFIPDLDQRVSDVSIFKRSLAVASWQTGSFARVAAVRDAATSIPGLRFVGDWLRSPLVESAIASTDALFEPPRAQ